MGPPSRPAMRFLGRNHEDSTEIGRAMAPGPGLWSPPRPCCSSYGSNVTESNGVEVMGSANAESISLLQAVADPVRWTVLAMLAEAPRCVCKLQEQVPIAGNLLSYHLKVLREAGLV